MRNLLPFIHGRTLIQETGTAVPLGPSKQVSFLRVVAIESNAAKIAVGSQYVVGADEGYNVPRLSPYVENGVEFSGLGNFDLAEVYVNGTATDGVVWMAY